MDTAPFSLATMVADVEGMTAAERFAHLRELELQMRRLEAELAVTVTVVQSSESFREDGHSSVRGMLRAELRWADAEVTHRLRTGSLLSDLAPAIEALGQGHIPVAHIRSLARARANPRCGSRLPEHADLLLGYARHMEFDDFHRCVRRWELLADSEGSHRDAEAAHENRNATLVEQDGIGYLSGHGGAVDTAEMKEIWDHFAQAEFHNDLDVASAQTSHQPGKPVPLPRTEQQRRWDALLAIFRTAAGQPADAKLPEPTLNIVMDLQTFEQALAELGIIPLPAHTLATPPVVPFALRRSDTANGALLDPVEAVRAALHGHVRRVIVDSVGNIIDLGRRRRLFTGAAREAVMLHSPRCIWPGCTTPAGYCNADHTHPWQHGGTTTSTNGAPLCPRHDRWKNGGYRVRRDPDGHWHTHRPDGTEIGAVA